MTAAIKQILLLALLLSGSSFSVLVFSIGKNRFNKRNKDWRVKRRHVLAKQFFSNAFHYSLDSCSSLVYWRLIEELAKGSTQMLDVSWHQFLNLRDVM